MSSRDRIETAAPVAAAERIVEMDALRGVALFGVFLVNMIGFAGAGAMATQGQLDALPTAGVDKLVRAGVRWLFYDKANTLFAFLFGLGFWVQMERIKGRGADFESLYLRRLAVLLCFGLIHLSLIFTWDILHTYALCGFLLLALRKSSNRTLLIGGVLLALFGRMAIELPLSLSGAKDALGASAWMTDAVVLERQALSQAGDYAGLVSHFAQNLWFTYLITAGLLGWMLYVLGRFMLGAWVGRRGWLQNAGTHAAGFRTWMWRLLPLGLAGEAIGQGLDSAPRFGLLPTSSVLEAISAAAHMAATPVLAAGYVCVVVVALQSRLGRALLSPFSLVGRMALTNYVGQSLIIGFVLFGVGPGLALAGRIGAAGVLAIVIAGFALQAAASRLWLSQFAYGPLEWVWRSLTYGRAPRLRLPRTAAPGMAPANKSG